MLGCKSSPECPFPFLEHVILACVHASICRRVSVVLVLGGEKQAGNEGRSNLIGFILRILFVVWRLASRSGGNLRAHSLKFAFVLFSHQMARIDQISVVDSSFFTPACVE